jgi:hypothetical protein
MCIPASNPGQYNPNSIFSGTTYSGMLGAGNPEFVAKARNEGQMQQVFGSNPFVLRSVAKTEGREFDPNDPYGSVYYATAKQRQALDQKIADFDKRQQQYEQSRAKLGTITETQAAVKTPSTAVRTPVQARPVRTSLKTSYGIREVPTSSTLGSSTGLNVPQ